MIPELTELARRAAAAGAAELGWPPHEVTVKGAAGDVVTEVDVRAERAVRAVLAAERPDDAVTGEELGSSAGSSAVRWSIDPLDGTTNFVRGLPYFASSVAAVDVATGEWLAGAVHAPALGDVYWAGRGEGAFRSRYGKTVRLSGPAGGAAPLLGTGFSYDSGIRDQQLGELAVRLPAFADIRRLGSAALEICLVAAGSLDAYVERDLAEHDWAAAALIAAEAGVVVKRPKRPGGEILIGPVRGI